MMDVTILGKAVDLAIVQDIPLFGVPIKAGFSSPANDWLEARSIIR
jgi:hypothetical protein